MQPQMFSAAALRSMCEVKAAKRIVSMLLQEGFEEIDDLDEKIDRAEKNLHQRLAPSQRNAVKLCLSYPISIMTGGPGSGKTTTLRFILDIYQAAFPSNEILLAAPTGRASRRMSEQTGKYASTLHSALGLVTEEDSPLNDKVDFGRFNGWALGDIAMKNPGDLAWYVKNYSGHNLALKAGATKLLEAVGQMAS